MLTTAGAHTGGNAASLLGRLANSAARAFVRAHPECVDDPLQCVSDAANYIRKSVSGFTQTNPSASPAEVKKRVGAAAKKLPQVLKRKKVQSNVLKPKGAKPKPKQAKVKKAKDPELSNEHKIRRLLYFGSRFADCAPGVAADRGDPRFAVGFRNCVSESDSVPAPGSGKNGFTFIFFAPEMALDDGSTSQNSGCWVGHFDPASNTNSASSYTYVGWYTTSDVIGGQQSGFCMGTTAAGNNSNTAATIKLTDLVSRSAPFLAGSNGETNIGDGQSCDYSQLLGSCLSLEVSAPLNCTPVVYTFNASTSPTLMTHDKLFVKALLNGTSNSVFNVVTTGTWMTNVVSMNSNYFTAQLGGVGYAQVLGHHYPPETVSAGGTKFYTSIAGPISRAWWPSNVTNKIGSMQSYTRPVSGATTGIDCTARFLGFCHHIVLIEGVGGSPAYSIRATSDWACTQASSSAVRGMLTPTVPLNNTDSSDGTGAGWGDAEPASLLAAVSDAKRNGLKHNSLIAKSIVPDKFVKQIVTNPEGGFLRTIPLSHF